MTAKINNQTATAIATAETVKLTVNGKTIEFPVDAATSVVTAVLAARKEGIELKRNVKKAERSAKAENTKAEQLIKLKARKAKLEAQLAKLAA